MKLDQINSLINIRQYVANSIGSFSLEKKVINELNAMVLLIDKKIIEGLLSDEFKALIDYEHAQEAKAEARRINSQIFSAVRERK